MLGIPFWGNRGSRLRRAPSESTSCGYVTPAVVIELDRGGGGVRLVDTNEADLLPRQLTIQASKHRGLIPAWCAPRRPDVEDDNVAREALQREVRALERRTAQGGGQASITYRDAADAGGLGRSIDVTGRGRDGAGTGCRE